MFRISLVAYLKVSEEITRLGKYFKYTIAIDLYIEIVYSSKINFDNDKTQVFP